MKIENGVSQGLLDNHLDYPMKSESSPKRGNRMVTPVQFDVKFTSREISGWGGLALLKRIFDGMDFKSAMQS